MPKEATSGDCEISIIRGFKEQIIQTAVKGSSDMCDPAFKQRGGRGDLLGSLSRVLPLFCTAPAKTSTQMSLPVTPSAISRCSSCIAVLSISFPLQHITCPKGRKMYVGCGCVPLVPRNHT